MFYFQSKISALVSIHLQIYCLPHGATMCLLKIQNFAPLDQLMSFGSTQAVRSSQVMPWHLGEDLFRNSWQLLGDLATVMVERMGDLWIYCIWKIMGHWNATRDIKRSHVITKIGFDWVLELLLQHCLSRCLLWCRKIGVAVDGWRTKCLNTPWGLQHSAELQRHSGEPRRFGRNKGSVGHNGKTSRAKCTKCACHVKVIDTRGLWRKAWYWT